MRFVKPHGSRSSNELRRLLPKKTHTPAPFHFLVDSTSSFRQLFVNEVWMCSTSSATAWKHPVGMTDLQVLKQLKIEMPCWTKCHVPEFVFFVAAGAALSDVIVTFTNQETLEVQRRRPLICQHSRGTMCWGITLLFGQLATNSGLLILRT